MNNILVSKSEKTYAAHVSDPNFKDVSSFILVKYMGMSPDPVVRQLALDNQETLEKMLPRILYRFLMRKTPRQRTGFIKFIR
jgi:hypothetical protein